MRNTKVRGVMLLMIFLALLLVIAAFWLIPRVLAPMAAKVPTRVPPEWVDEYGTRHRG
jgi:hypothetical protein